jgi:hypothetical protein
MNPFLPFLLATSVTAADLVVRDATLAIEREPTTFDWALGPYAGDDAFTSHLGLVGGLRWSFAPRAGSLGLILGAEAAIGDGTFADGGSLRWSETRAVAGLGWAPATRWTVQVVARAAAGVDRLDLDLGQAGGSATGDGTHLAWTPEAGLWWDAGDAWRLGVAAGWRWSDTSIATNAGDLELSQSGPTLAVTVAWSLTRAPGSLE